MSDSQAGQGTLRVLVYSDDVDVRQQVILALGRRPHPDLPELEYVEVATEPVVLQNMDAGGIDLAILDGEAVPAGGMGIAKQLKDEIYHCPPVLVLIGRPQDAWLADLVARRGRRTAPDRPGPARRGRHRAAASARARPPPDRRDRVDDLTWAEVLGALVQRQDLTADQTPWAMGEILAGAATPAQIAGFAVALRAKGETIDEVTGLLDAMYAVATPLDDPRPGPRRGRHRRRPLDERQHLDDGRDRGRGRRCPRGQARQPLGLEPGRLRRRARGPRDPARPAARPGGPAGRAGRHHLLLRGGLPPGACDTPPCPRRELAIATTFNVLGPLANPVKPAAQAIGCADPRMAPIMAGVLARRGVDAWVFRGDDGLDELTTTTTSRAWLVHDGIVTPSSIDPAALGLPTARPEDLRGGDVAHNADVVRRVLGGETGPVRDAVLLNAAAALAVYETPAAQAEEALPPALVRVAEAVDTGAAADVLTRWVAASAG